MTKVEKALQSAFQRRTFRNRLAQSNINTGPKLNLEKKRQLEISLALLDPNEIERNFQNAPEKMIELIKKVSEQ